MNRVKIWSLLVFLGLITGVQASDQVEYFGLSAVDPYVGIGVEQQSINFSGFKDTQSPGLVFKLGKSLAAWVDAEFRFAANQQRINMNQSGTANVFQLDDFYDVSGLVKFKWAAAQSASWHVHAILGYNFNRYNGRMVSNTGASEAASYTQDGFMYGLGTNLRFDSRQAIELSYLSLQRRDSFDNDGQMQRETLGVSWLYHY